MAETISAEQVEEQIARALLSIGAVSLSPHAPYTWASGLKSPIYCDNRMIMGYPEIRGKVTAGFVAAIANAGFNFDVLAGTATAGIPHAAWLAHALACPMIYVRSKAKGHGRQNQIEGPLPAGQNVLVIEDLVSTGKSSMAAVEALQDAGANVVGVLAIFSYGFDGAAAVFNAANVPCHTLTNFHTLLQVASETGHLQEDQVRTMQNWRQDPKVWSEQAPA
ncbi:MAG: orotate phosphoribosyltransferase [Bacteroidota bacterium]